MRVFITGTSGLIGKWLAELLLQQGHEIRGYDWRENPHDHLQPYCVIGDILDYDVLLSAVQDSQPDAIIHLAARIDLDGTSLADYEANVSGVENMCRVVREIPSVKRFICTSSQLVCKVGYVPSSDEEYCPNTIYGESKVKTEEIVRRLDGGGVSWCLARPTTVWGPYMSEHYKSLLRHIQKGTFFHSGKGALHKSYAYAGNIAYQYSKLLVASEEEIHRKVFYLADYEPLSLRDYVNALSLHLKVKKPITVPLLVARILALGGDLLNGLGIRFPYNSFRLRNIRTEYIFDMSPTQAVCGELPYSFEEGVKATADWYLQDKIS